MSIIYYGLSLSLHLIIGRVFKGERLIETRKRNFILIFVFIHFFLTGCTFNVKIESLSDESSVVFKKPIPTLSTVVVGPTNLTTIPVRIDFNTPVNGTIEDHFFTVTNGVISNLSGNGTSYTFNISPLLMSGAVQIHFPEDQVADTAGNKNVASNTLNINIDSTKPAVAISKNNTQSVTTNTLPVEFKIEFSEPIDPSSFMSSDITQNGTATGITWDLVVTPNTENKVWILRAVAVTGMGTLIPIIDLDKINDLAGNGNLASNVMNSGVTFDNVPPGIAMSMPVPTSGTKNTEFVWTVTYSDADSITLGINDVVITGTATAGCSVTDISLVGAVRTVKVKGCTSQDGNMGIQIKADTARDSFGNKTPIYTDVSSIAMIIEVPPKKWTRG